jgi:dUTP pyrophosphatase
MYTLQLLLTNDKLSTYYMVNSAERNNDNAGYDLYVPDDVEFGPGEKKLVTMQVKAILHNGKEDVHYWMLPRSSISKTGLMLCNSVGVIDRTYRGELMAYLWNTKDVPVIVKKGDRLLQIVAPDMGHISRVEFVGSFNSTGRGEGGFGSSGR